MNNPPAFPIQHQVNANGDVVQWSETGMTLRDYFAAKVMQGDIASTGEHSGPINILLLAKWSYEVADAMLAERSKGEPAK